jgi:hypothetical protein
LEVENFFFVLAKYFAEKEMTLGKEVSPGKESLEPKKESPK